MKKLITLLAAAGLIVGAGATAISCGCGKQSKDEPNENPNEDSKSFAQEFFNDLKKVDLEKFDENLINKTLEDYINKQKKLPKWKDYKFAKNILIDFFNNKPDQKPDHKLDELEGLAKQEIIFVWWILNWGTSDLEIFDIVIEGFIGVEEGKEVKPKTLGYVEIPLLLLKKIITNSYEKIKNWVINL